MTVECDLGPVIGEYRPRRSVPRHKVAEPSLLAKLPSCLIFGIICFGWAAYGALLMGALLLLFWVAG